MPGSSAGNGVYLVAFAMALVLAAVCLLRRAQFPGNPPRGRRRPADRTARHELAELPAEIEQLIAQVDAAADRLTARADREVARLEHLLRAADERIARLEAARPPALAGHRILVPPKTPPPRAPTPGNWTPGAAPKARSGAQPPPPPAHSPQAEKHRRPAGQAVVASDVTAVQPAPAAPAARAPAAGVKAPGPMARPADGVADTSQMPPLVASAVEPEVGRAAPRTPSVPTLRALPAGAVPRLANDTPETPAMQQAAAHAADSPGSSRRPDSTVQDAAQKLAPVLTVARNDRVAELAASGRSAAEIAETLHIPIGEVELLINLRRFATAAQS